MKADGMMKTRLATDIDVWLSFEIGVVVRIGLLR